MLLERRVHIVLTPYPFVTFDVHTHREFNINLRITTIRNRWTLLLHVIPVSNTHMHFFLCGAFRIWGFRYVHTIS